MQVGWVGRNHVGAEGKCVGGERKMGLRKYRKFKILRAWRCGVRNLQENERVPSSQCITEDG